MMVQNWQFPGPFSNPVKTPEERDADIKNLPVICDLCARNFKKNGDTYYWSGYTARQGNTIYVANCCKKCSDKWHIKRERRSLD
jgi:hypothetical protein